jgi:hypothetical protein
LILAPQKDIEVEPVSPQPDRQKCGGTGKVPHTKVNLSISCNHFVYGMVQKGGSRGAQERNEGEKNLTATLKYILPNSPFLKGNP